MRLKKKLLFGIIAVCMTLPVMAQKNVIDEVIWVVGDEAILRSDVENLRLFSMQSDEMRYEGDPYCYFPELIAVRKLFLNQAKIDSVYADESAVIRYIDNWANQMINYHGSQEKLEEHYRGKKLAQIKEEQKQFVREQYIEKEMQDNIVGNIRLTPSAVQKYFNQLSKDSLPMIPTLVEVEVITMEPYIPITDIDAIKARLREFTEQINNGTQSMRTLASMYSEDLGTSMKGGETGFLSKTSLDPAFANAAFSLNDPNRVSSIVESEFGFHIIQLIEKRGDRINCRHILLRPKVSDQELEKTINMMDTLYQTIMEEKEILGVTMTFENAAFRISSDKDTRNNKGLMVNKDMESNNYGTSKFEMEELPLGMGVVVDKLAVGEMSQPFIMKNATSKDVVAIARLKSRVNAHRANVSDDYQILKRLVEYQKREEILSEWIESKQKTTYIRIAEGWRNCDFKYPGWIKD